MPTYQETRTTQNEMGREQRVTTFKVTQMIWLLLGLLEALLGLRFVFKLIAVNPANPFAALLYQVSDFFLAPFATLAKAPAAGGMVLELSTLLAMLIYLLIGWALAKIVFVLFYRPRGPVSVRQTTIAEHTSQEQAPFTDSHTTVTDRTNTQTTDDTV